MYEAYRHLAENLGLRLSTDPGMMTFVFDVYGDVDGQPMVLRRLCGSGARIDITVSLRPHLDLGLGITRTGVVSRVAEWLGGHDIEVGDAAFDSAFTLRGDEPDRVRALLSPDVRDVVASMSMSSFEINDGALTCGRRCDFVETSDDLERDVREAAAIARAVGAAYMQVPPAAALRPHYECLSRYAIERQLRIAATPLWVEGKMEGTSVLVRGERVRAEEFWLQLSASLGQPFVSPFSVEPKPKPKSSAFDDVFTLRGEHANAVDDAVRARLLELHRAHAAPSLRGGEIALRVPATIEPAGVPRLLESLADLLALTDRNLRGATPYR
jgi:hypothetical protein